MARCYYRSHINNLYPVIYDGSHERPRFTRGARRRTETMAGNPRKRLEKLEQQMAEIARRESAANCNCRTHTLAAAAEYFAAEMNKTCPVHGFRRLGKIQIMEVQVVGRNGSIEERSQGVAELVQEYEERLARHRQQILEKDAPEDL